MAEQVSDYITEDIKHRIQQLKQTCGDKIYSDVIDDEGNQYVDVVMEGGAMLGIALVGYLYVLEEMGIRFRGIAGTSAGSIVALSLAAFGTPQQKKTPKILDEMINIEFMNFVDNWRVKKMIRRYLSKEAAQKAKKKGKIKTFLGYTQFALSAMPLVSDLFRKWGVNSGDNFETWMAGILRKHDIESIADLEAVMHTPPSGYRLRDGTQTFNRDIKAQMQLAVFASDITTETVVTFPKMAELYWHQPAKLNPAKLVRASMSIPFFYEPLVVNEIPREHLLGDKWQSHAGFNPFKPADTAAQSQLGLFSRAPAEQRETDIPDDAINDIVFVDGGVMSNFPIHAFHVDKHQQPQAPTFGVKLSNNQRHNQSRNLWDIVRNTFNSARHALDYRFIYKNPEYKLLFQPIETEGFNSLNFDMTTQEKQQLFAEGVAAAVSFLSSFQWDTYRAYRANLNNAYHSAYKALPET